MNIQKIVVKAQQSSFYLKILNMGISRMVPFNKPHGFRITALGKNTLKTMVPYRRSNFNHIRGIHACALATLSEFTTGFLLLTRLDAKKYRLIMQSLQMNYHYQAKMDAYGSFEISDEWMEENIYKPLTSAPKVTVQCEVKIHDREGNHLSTGLVNWQIKSWEQVKTKV